MHLTHDDRLRRLRANFPETCSKPEQVLPRADRPITDTVVGRNTRRRYQASQGGILAFRALAAEIARMSR